jgi:hypothetical protein
MCANIHAPLANDDLYYSLSFLFSSFTLKEMSEWKRKTSVHLIRIHDDKEEREKRDMIYIFNRRSDCHHMSFLYFDHHLTTSTWCFLFNRWEKSFFEALNEWEVNARTYTAYGVLNCVKSCLGWWLFTSRSLFFHLPELLIRQHLLNDEKKRRRKRHRWRRRTRMNT